MKARPVWAGKPLGVLAQCSPGVKGYLTIGELGPCVPAEADGIRQHRAHTRAGPVQWLAGSHHVELRELGIVCLCHEGSRESEGVYGHKSSLLPIPAFRAQKFQ